MWGEYVRNIAKTLNINQTRYMSRYITKLDGDLSSGRKSRADFNSVELSKIC